MNRASNSSVKCRTCPHPVRIERQQQLQQPRWPFLRADMSMDTGDITKKCYPVGCHLSCSPMQGVCAPSGCKCLNAVAQSYAAPSHLKTSKY
jgi:hypothetical protein